MVTRVTSLDHSFLVFHMHLSAGSQHTGKQFLTVCVNTESALKLEFLANWIFLIPLDYI